MAVGATITQVLHLATRADVRRIALALPGVEAAKESLIAEAWRCQASSDLKITAAGPAGAGRARSTPRLRSRG
jgi:hypothetical protein